MTIYRYRAEAIYPGSMKPRLLTVEAKSIGEARALARGKLRMTYAELGRVTNLGRSAVETMRVEAYRDRSATADVGELHGQSNRTNELLTVEVDVATYEDVRARLRRGEMVDLDVDPVRVVVRRQPTLGDYGVNSD